MKKLDKKGFTLAELLIVVAIIAILVAIAIPVFNSQLEKSRETSDTANLRAAKAAATVLLLDNQAPEDVATGTDFGGYGSGTNTFKDKDLYFDIARGVVTADKTKSQPCGKGTVALGNASSTKATKVSMFTDGVNYYYADSDVSGQYLLVKIDATNADAPVQVYFEDGSKGEAT